MIQLVLDRRDIARVRFAYSPCVELVASVRLLRDSRRHYMYQSWLGRLDGHLDGLATDLLWALIRPWGYLPDFLTPTPTAADSDIEAELDTIAATPSDVVRAQLDLLALDGGLPAALTALYADPAKHLPELVGQLDVYWHAAIEPIWSRIRSLALADIGYRMEHIASGGVAHMLNGLHPELSFDDDRLMVRHGRDERTELGGRGIVLTPAVFLWPTVMVTARGQDQPLLCYAPRGVADMSEEDCAQCASPLEALVGRTRATLLTMLRLPMTTKQLADELDMSPSSISQHLHILKASSLVESRRLGRIVLYHRTPTAKTLLDAPAHC